jgi:hypothetical protein
MYGYIFCIAILTCVIACEHADRAVLVPVVDLIDEFERAEKRPSGGFRVPAHTANGVTLPAIVMPIPSRVTWRVLLPRGGLLRTSVTRAGAVPGTSGVPPLRLRIGIADDRIYETLTEITPAPEQRGWIDLRIDLSAYAGWKWSLFYRPDRILWSLVLAADGAPGQGSVVWGTSEIVTDRKAAREYAARRRDMTAK